MKKTLRISIAVATVLMLALCLTSCDAYGFLSTFGLSDRMQAAALEGASEKYYATRGELESTYDMEYSGSIDGERTSYKNRSTQTVKFLDSGDDMKYVVDITNSYTVKQGDYTVSDVTGTKIAYLDGYMYYSSGTSARGSSMRDAMTKDEFLGALSSGSEGTPYFESKSVTARVTVSEDEDAGTITAVFEDYAAADDGELLYWLTYYFGFSGMECEIIALNVTSVYDMDTHAMISRTVSVEFGISDGGDVDLECKLGIKDKYFELDESSLNADGMESWKEVDGLDSLMYAQDAASHLADWTEGDYTISTKVTTSSQILLSDVTNSITYERDADGLSYKVISTGVENAQSLTYSTEYRDGELAISLTKNGSTNKRVEMIDDHEAEAMLEAILTDPLSFSVAQVEDLSTVVNDDGTVVLTVTLDYYGSNTSNDFDIEFVLTEDKLIKSCKMTVVEISNANYENRSTRTEFILTDNYFGE